MAIAFRAKQHAVIDSASYSSITCNKPAGVVDGDFLLAFLAQNNGTFNNLYPITPPSGWFTLVAPTDAWPSGDRRLIAVYWKIAASEGASWTWSHPVLAGQGEIVVSAYSGGVVAIEATEVQVSSSLRLSVPFNGITTSSANTRLVTLCMQDINNTFTPASGMTERHDVGVGADLATHVADVAFVGPGATGGKTVTITGSTTAAVAGVLLALSTAAAGGAANRGLFMMGGL